MGWQESPFPVPLWLVQSPLPPHSDTGTFKEEPEQRVILTVFELHGMLILVPHSCGYFREALEHQFLPYG